MLNEKKEEKAMSEFVLQTIGLTKKYPHTTALDNVNVTIKRGESMDLLGKTEPVRLHLCV